MKSFFQSSSTLISRLFANNKIPTLLAILAGVVYLVQAVLYAHTGPVTMDEGTYLAKGLLYVTGVYRPFQDYGPWTNKMPLAFLIPGAAQVLFGPGLRTGRYFAIFLGLLMLAGLWLAAKRSAGKAAAVILLWVVALDPATISYYSTAISQGIVACMLTWMLAFSLGENRKLWEIGLAAVLASMMVMTRQNLAPVIPFFLLFVFWQYGRRAGLTALAVCALVLGAFHWIYYPNIFKLWASFIPEPIKTWLMPTPAGTSGSGGTATPLMAPSLLTGLYVFWEGVRYNLFATVGTLAACFFWPRRRAWASETRFKTSVYLLFLFMCLTAIHLWAAVGKDYCPYCYSGYLAFFSPCALLLVVVSFSSWVQNPGPARRVLAAAAVFLLCAGIGFGAYQQIGGALASMPVPRIRGMQIQPGNTEAWRLLANKFGWEYADAQQVLSAAAGFIAGGLLLLAGGRSRALARKNGPPSSAPGGREEFSSCSAWARWFRPPPCWQAARTSPAAAGM